MAASAEIAGRDIGLAADRRRQIVTSCVREYREAMRGFAGVSHLDVWYERINASELVERFGGRLGKHGRIVFTKPFAKARRKTSVRAVEKLTESVDGELRFRSVPPLLVRFSELHDPTDPRDQTDYVRDLLNAYLVEPRRGPALPVQHLPVRRHRAQGRRRRERRDSRVGAAVRGPWRRRPADPADEGGAGVGARAAPGQQRVREPRRARRPRPADGSGGVRRIPRLAAEPGARRHRSTTSTSVSCGTGRHRSTSRR